MLSELAPSAFHAVFPLDGITGHPVVNAVIEGHTPGRIFVDDVVAPRAVFILTTCGYSYLAGVADNTAFNAALAALLTESLLPAQARSGDPSLVFYPLTPEWGAAIPALLPDLSLLALYRRTFTFDAAAFAARRAALPPLPDGFTLRPIDADFLAHSQRQMDPWSSNAAFLGHGCGFCVLDGETPVSECFTVFVGAGVAEIEIRTEEVYRRRGCATHTAAALIAACLERGLRPNWECWWENEPSTGLAQKLGFEMLEDHPVYLWEAQ